MHRGRHRERYDSEALKKSKSFMLVVWLAIPILFLIVFFKASMPLRHLFDPERGTTVHAKEGVIRIPLMNIGPKAVFYQYKSTGNKTVRFFAVKTVRGEYLVAQDACDACYRENRGFHQEGEEFVCNSCRRRTPSAKLDAATDECAPRPIPLRIEDKQLIIAAAELEARANLTLSHVGANQ